MTLKNSLSLCLFFAVLSSCNSLVVTHTQGQASDVVDSAPSMDAKVDANLSPTLNVPSKI